MPLRAGPGVPGPRPLRDRFRGAGPRPVGGRLGCHVTHSGAVGPWPFACPAREPRPRDPGLLGPAARYTTRPRPARDRRCRASERPLALLLVRARPTPTPTAVGLRSGRHSFQSRCIICIVASALISLSSNIFAFIKSSILIIYITIDIYFYK